MASVASDWHLTRDLEVFLDRAGGFLRSEPALHTVQLTVTDALGSRGPAAYGPEPPHFAWLTDRDGAVRATALRTPPYELNLTPTTPEAADALAARLSEAGSALPGVNGPADTAAAVATAWERRTGTTAQLTTNQRLYRLGTLAPPAPAPPGRARLATGDDRALAARWHAEFAAAAGGPAMRDSDRWAEGRIAHGGITFWVTPDGTPVSMAGALPKVAGQIRIAPVYTPPALRGHGYATAVTAAVSRAAQAAGADEVLLFTDLANPTSNALYQRIGYRPVRDFAVHTFRM
ncbi:GNAT family N-acetyltransferase [Streptomyces sp. NBC_00286]|uniref:GNAT family N-acetyltransferase n=1 Tax=Streptomyces sp. NBC_00286 TaxID=2975701 RepID=UPI002E292ACB|nr:GNAT family N-acetyltransferase [Streptomyces sp. NBC_00286]